MPTIPARTVSHNRLRERIQKGNFFWMGLSVLALLYFAIILGRGGHSEGVDEISYLRIAESLTRGQLPWVAWRGPGYPLVLAVFLKLGLPLLAMRLANAFFLLGTVICVRAALRLYLPSKQADALALALGLYLPFLIYLVVAFSETLTGFLVSAVMYHYLAIARGHGPRLLHQVAATIALTWLVLTKVLFAYVVVACLAVGLLVWAVRSRRLGRTLAILAGALLLCVPYLVHNEALTGKWFYWATSGGTSLYWMSSPFPGETGTWIRERDVSNYADRERNHGAFFRSIQGLSQVEQDDAFKRAALRNIRENPLKFAYNIVANMSRMLFHFPYDLRPKDSKQSGPVPFPWIAIPNALLLGWLIATLHVVARAGGKTVSAELWCILFFAGVYFGGSSLLSAYSRMFSPIVPILGTWTACVWFSRERATAAPRSFLLSR